MMTENSPDPNDIVTQVQDQIVHLCAGFFNFTGALQRDAPPTSIAGENIVRPAHQPYNMREQAQLMASELLRGFQELERLINRLPDGSETEEAQLTTAVELQKQSTEALYALTDELARAQLKLERLQRAHSITADVLLQGSGSNSPEKPP